MIYLDYNSTSKISKDVRSYLSGLSDEPYNPSSVHYFGRNARKLLENARSRIAKSLECSLGRGGYKIIFTSGGTEANNLVLKNYKDNHILYSPTEHASIIDVVKSFKNSMQLKVDQDGVLDLGFLEYSLKKLDGSKILVTVMGANNETGTIQPVAEILELTKKYNAKFHSDFVQICGKEKIDFSELDIDYATISAHKIGGIIGTGALIVKDELFLVPEIIGGGQERGERSGTENVIGASAMAIALEKACDNLDEYKRKTYQLRNYVETEISKHKDAVIISKNVNRLCNTSMIAAKNIDSNKQLIQFDMNNIAVSNGSACSSGKVKFSHVLRAMGYDEDIASCSIRVSFGIDNTIEDATQFVEIWNKINIG
jgi:cysteine desulfurase